MRVSIAPTKQPYITLLVNKRPKNRGQPTSYGSRSPRQLLRLTTTRNNRRFPSPQAPLPASRPRFLIHPRVSPGRQSPSVDSRSGSSVFDVQASRTTGSSSFHRSRLPRHRLLSYSHIDRLWSFPFGGRAIVEFSADLHLIDDRRRRPSLPSGRAFGPSNAMERRRGCPTGEAVQQSP